MSNLGLYQTIVEQAKGVGGVENLVAEIGRGAVAKEAPRLVGLGVFIGVGTVAALVGVGYGAKCLWDARVERLADAGVAERKLKQIVQASADPDGEVPDEPIADDEGH